MAKKQKTDEIKHFPNADQWMSNFAWLKRKSGETKPKWKKAAEADNYAKNDQNVQPRPPTPAERKFGGYKEK